MTAEELKALADEYETDPDCAAALRVLAAIAEQVDARVITLRSAREFTKASAQIRALDAGINELAAIAALITEGTK